MGPLLKGLCFISPENISILMAIDGCQYNIVPINTSRMLTQDRPPTYICYNRLKLFLNFEAKIMLIIIKDLTKH